MVPRREMQRFSHSFYNGFLLPSGLRNLLVAVVCLGLGACGCQRQAVTGPGPSPNSAALPDAWNLQRSGSTASLRGICAVSDRICWASGSGGTVLVTSDGGETWRNVGPEGSAEMDFRDVHAWDEKSAVVMCAGDPDRIYRTATGGESWEVVHEHADAAAFFDGMVFDQAGIQGWLMGDPVDGRLFVLQTTDSGKTWQQLPAGERPEIPSGIAGFAASGTNLCLAGNSLVVGLGGAATDQALIIAPVAIRTGDGSWSLVNTPIPAGESSGVFSVVSMDESGQDLVAVGGDYLQVDRAEGNIALSRDAGQTWRLPRDFPPTGFRSAVALATRADVRDADIDTLQLIAVGPSGTDLSTDRGDSWDPVSREGFHTVSFVAGTEIGWAAGSDGRIGRWNPAARAP